MCKCQQLSEAQQFAGSPLYSLFPQVVVHVTVLTVCAVCAVHTFTSSHAHSLPASVPRWEACMVPKEAWMSPQEPCAMGSSHRDSCLLQQHCAHACRQRAQSRMWLQLRASADTCAATSLLLPTAGAAASRSASGCVPQLVWSRTTVWSESHMHGQPYDPVYS